jgi:hypothetical protein
MPPSINFDKFANRDAAGIKVTGVGTNEASDPLFEGAQLVTRHVALQQGTHFAQGPATLDSQWETKPPLTDDAFEAGEALGIATETHVVGGDAIPGAVASFVTVTWSQRVTIT